ncbi:alpha/beta hydrolase [Mucilaginibacter panaciglaebae]|uniref:AB hydrolase-1 domain-containing protein n=1 Tax=Mucilaginibacter panaciglaebae TaxID=502331 RepID=A0ABP7X201_9SPHI
MKNQLFTCLLSLFAALPAIGQQPKSSAGGHAPVNGIQMYYEIHGTGNIPLVLIHGGGSTIETSFSKLLPLLAKHYKVIAVELQAHGRTSDRNKPESFTQDADDVAGLLKYLQVSKANLLGFSNGGSTALQVAIRHPHLVNKIIAISAATKRGGLIDGFFKGFEGAKLSSMPKPLQDGYLKVNKGNKKGLQTMFNRDVERMKNFHDWPDDDLRHIKAPTLLISTDRDVIKPEHTLELASLIPHAHAMILPGVHGEFFGEICSPHADTKMIEATGLMLQSFIDK